MNHKYKIAFLIAVALMVTPCVVYSQDDFGGGGRGAVGLEDVGLRFGAKVGFGSADLSLAKFSKLGSSRTTFSVGGFAEYRLNTWLSAAAGVEYTQNGGANLPTRLFFSNVDPYVFTGVPGTGIGTRAINSNLRVHTLEIPITARLSMPEMNGMKPFFLIGPSIGVNIAAKTTDYLMDDYGFGATYGNMVYEYSQNVGGRISPADFSVLIGTGSEFSAYGYIFELGVTYRMGLLNQNDFKYALYQEYTSNSLMATIAIKF